MKKGLNVTLLTVAIAVMALQAMAMAPVITDIKSPIVGSTGATGSTPFVYPDAFDITAKATDDSTSSANVRWSYYYSGNEVYRINNVARVALSDAAIKEPGAARINGSIKDSGDLDSQAATITIRNVKYAPIGGSVTTPSTTGIIDAMPVTLFASDGTTYSQKSVYFYTDNGGNNRLSPGDGGTPVWTPECHQAAFPTSGTMTWGWDAFHIGSITSNTSSGTGVCIDSALLGANYGSWTSSWGYFSVAKNTIYRIRLNINGSMAVGHTPFMDVFLSNFSSDGTQGFNLFGADLLIFDNDGGANAPYQKTGGTTYDWYWTPACVNHDVYNNDTNMWSAGNANNRKMQLTFRVMDVNNSGPGGTDVATANVDSGMLCLKDVQIDSIPYSKMQLEQVWVNPAMTSSNMNLLDIFGTAAVTGGKIRIDRKNAGGNDSAAADYGYAQPGDSNMDYATPSTFTDNFPMTWVANTLYLINWSMSAVDATSAANPLDAIVSGMDTPMNEFIENNYVTSTANYIAMPKTTASDYLCFFNSMNVSVSATAQFRTWRPRVEWLNSPQLTTSASTGSFLINGCTISKVTFTN